MNKENKLIPELRFPEFVKEGEWEEKELEEIAFSESSSMALNKLELKTKGYPVYGADSIVGYIDSFQQTDKYISIVKDGSGVGRLNLCQSHSSILGTLACIKSKNQQNYYLDWIYYLLNTIDFSVYVKGAGIPHIYYSDFKKENIAVPQPKEQQKIASCLSSLDELITDHNQKLALLKNHKKGLMQNLFPQMSELGFTRLKDDGITETNHKKILQSANPKNPNSDNVPKWRFEEFEKDGEWELEKLKNVFTIFQGFAFSSNDSVSNGARWLKISDVGIQQMNHDTPSYLPFEFKEKYKNFLVKEGDYVIALTRPILDKKLKIAKVDCILNDSLLNQRVGKLVSNKCVDFVYYLIQTSKLVSNIEQNITGSEPPNLSTQQIENIEVFIPPTKVEQQKIASCLSSLDELIKAQAEKIEQLKLHKKGLMQGLFPKVV